MAGVAFFAAVALLIALSVSALPPHYQITWLEWCGS